MYTISNDPNDIDFEVVYSFLSSAYWSSGVSRERVQSAIDHSLCFGLFTEDGSEKKRQIGFARAITDQTNFAYLCDVFVLEEFQGKGAGTWFIESVFKSEQLREVKRFLLTTKDAHPFYENLGFSHLLNPDTLMEMIRQAPLREEGE